MPSKDANCTPVARGPCKAQGAGGRRSDRVSSCNGVCYRATQPSCAFCLIFISNLAQTAHWAALVHQYIGKVEATFESSQKIFSAPELDQQRTGALTNNTLNGFLRGRETFKAGPADVQNGLGVFRTSRPPSRRPGRSVRRDLEAFVAEFDFDA